MFINATIVAGMNSFYTEYKKYLSDGESILVIGCGRGRDSKYFSQKGYSVTSIEIILCAFTVCIVQKTITFRSTGTA